MNDGDKQRFAELMGLLGITFQREVTTEVIKAYWLILHDVELRAFESAVQEHLNTGKFFPRPAELRESIQGSIDARALLAWDKLNEIIDRTGSYSTIWVDDPALAHTIQHLGGWIRLCGRPEGESWDVWTRKEFLAAYPQYLDRQDSPILIGIHDQTNKNITPDNVQIHRLGFPGAIRPLLDLQRKQGLKLLGEIIKEPKE